MIISSGWIDGRKNSSKISGATEALWTHYILFVIFIYHYISYIGIYIYIDAHTHILYIYIFTFIFTHTHIYIYTHTHRHTRVFLCNMLHSRRRLETECRVHQLSSSVSLGLVSFLGTLWSPGRNKMGLYYMDLYGFKWIYMGFIWDLNGFLWMFMGFMWVLYGI